MEDYEMVKDNNGNTQSMRELEDKTNRNYEQAQSLIQQQLEGQMKQAIAESENSSSSYNVDALEEISLSIEQLKLDLNKQFQEIKSQIVDLKSAENKSEQSGVFIKAGNTGNKGKIGWEQVVKMDRGAIKAMQISDYCWQDYVYAFNSENYRVTYDDLKIIYELMFDRELDGESQEAVSFYKSFKEYIGKQRNSKMSYGFNQCSGMWEFTYAGVTDIVCMVKNAKQRRLSRR